MLKRPRLFPVILTGIALGCGSAQAAELVPIIDFDSAAEYTSNFQRIGGATGTIVHDASDDLNWGEGGFLRESGNNEALVYQNASTHFTNYTLDIDVRFSDATNFVSNSIILYARPTNVVSPSSGRALWVAFGVNDPDGGEVVDLGFTGDYGGASVGNRTSRNRVPTAATTGQWLHLRMDVETIIVGTPDDPNTPVDDFPRLTFYVYDNPDTFNAGTLLYSISENLPAIDETRTPLPGQGNNYLLPGFVSFALRSAGASTVDVDNFAIYELGTAPAQIPEPASAAVMLGMSGLLALRRGR